MKKELFSPMEIDAIGEMMNISLGSSATAVSNLLDQRVDITTPEVSVVEVEDFSIGNLEPAMGVEIKYVEGLEGSNIMLLRRSDIKVIVDILMGGETPEEEFELNDLTISAVCEVMNQMMGAASTAMSDFLGFPVNISTPVPFELENLQEFKENHLPIKPGYIVKFGSEIVKKRDGLSVEKVLDKYGIEDNYILAVGSIAPKKNYATIYKAYTIMMHKYSKTKIPQLVIVGGKFGGGFLSECIEKDPLIARKIIMIAPDDEELDILYRSCKFTILPTLYEGWSLTLPESLAYNKFCLSSNVAPLKEIAGELVDYVEPMDVSGWAEKVHYYANNPQKVEEYVSRIKAEWTPITWKDCGKTVNDYLTEINSESSHEETSVYYDMTLAWQLSLSGAGVSGILRTQLLLARYLCYKSVSYTHLTLPTNSLV